MAGKTRETVEKDRERSTARMPTADRDAWIEPVLDMIRVQRGERLAFSAACIALAGNSHEESAARLDGAIAALRAADEARGMKVEYTWLEEGHIPYVDEQGEPTHYRLVSDWHPVEQFKDR